MNQVGNDYVLQIGQEDGDANDERLWCIQFIGMGQSFKEFSSSDQLLRHIEQNKDEYLQATILNIAQVDLTSTSPTSTLLLRLGALFPNATTLWLSCFMPYNDYTQDLDVDFALDEQGPHRITKLILTNAYVGKTSKIFKRIGEIKSLKSLVLDGWYKDEFFNDMPALTLSLESLPLLQELTISCWELNNPPQEGCYFDLLLTFLDRNSNAILLRTNDKTLIEYQDGFFRYCKLDLEKIKSANFWATVNQATVNYEGPVEALIGLQDRFDCFHYVLSKLLPPHAFCHPCPTSTPKQISWSHFRSHPPCHGVDVVLRPS